MLNRNDMVNLNGKSASMVTNILKKFGDGDMSASPLKIWDSAKLKCFIIFGTVEIVQIGVLFAPKVYKKIKEKIDESNRIHDIIVDNQDEENIENEIKGTEEL